MSGEGTKDMATTFQPDWENCPDCGAYFQGSHLCDQSREAVLLRVEAKLDAILKAVAGIPQLEYLGREGYEISKPPTSSKETT